MTATTSCARSARSSRRRSGVSASGSPSPATRSRSSTATWAAATRSRAPKELRLIADVARTEALLLDPVYTGNAFYGMTRELERHPRSLGDRIVFVHTGGIFGLFPKAEEMAAVL